jgi:anti-sigma regulatory factor (Ser/Thr protein kinase)
MRRIYPFYRIRGWVTTKKRSGAQSRRSTFMQHMSPARHLTFYDEPSSAAALRAAVDELAEENALPEDARFELKVAATEALANALKRSNSAEHSVEVALQETDDAIEIEIQGRGEFRLDYGAESDRGRGLPLMVALVDEVEFASTGEGTRVRIRKRLDRAA